MVAGGVVWEVWYGVEMAFRSSCAQVFIFFSLEAELTLSPPSVGCVVAKTSTLQLSERQTRWIC